MKKVFLSLAVLASVALVSCGDKKAENADTATLMETDTTTITVETPAVDCPNQPAAPADQAATEAAKPEENKDAKADAKDAKADAKDAKADAKDAKADAKDAKADNKDAKAEEKK